MIVKDAVLIKMNRNCTVILLTFQDLNGGSIVWNLSRTHIADEFRSQLKVSFEASYAVPASFREVRSSTLVEVDMHVDKYQTGECALSPNTQVQNELELFVKVIEQIHQSYCDLCTRVLLTANRHLRTTLKAVLVEPLSLQICVNLTSGFGC